MIPKEFYSIINIDANNKNVDEIRTLYEKLAIDYTDYLKRAGIRVPQQSNIKLEFSLASTNIIENIYLFSFLLDDEILYPELNFASFYDENTYLKLEKILEILKPQAKTQINVFTPLINTFIEKILKEEHPFKIIPAIFSSMDAHYLINKLIGNDSGLKEKITHIKIFPCSIRDSFELINSLSHPIPELKEVMKNLSFHSEASESLELISAKDINKILCDKDKKVFTIKKAIYENRLKNIKEIIEILWKFNPEIKISCAGFGGISLSEIQKFYTQLLNTLDTDSKLNKNFSLATIADKISIATRNNNFHEIQKFFKYSSI